MPKISICLPAYREADNLALLLSELKKQLAGTGANAEILVIDSQVSLDNTREICEVHAVQYINREGDDSYGAAVKTALKTFSGDYIVFMDADLSHSPEVLNGVLAAIEGGYDIVVASRFIQGGGPTTRLQCA